MKGRIEAQLPGEERPGVARGGWLPALIVGLTTVVLALLTVLVGSPWVMLVPAGLLGLGLIIPRLFGRPAFVLGLFLLLVINLDVIKVAGRLSLDVVLSALLVWALLLRSGLARANLLRHPVAKAYLLFLVVTLISVFLSVDPATSFKRWGRDLEYLVLFGVLLALPLALRDRRRLVAALILSSLIPCAIGVLSLFVDMSGLFRGHYLHSGMQGMRVTANLSHPVTLALYLTVTATTTISLLLSGTWFRRRWLLPLALLQVVVLFLTFGRSGWLAFVAALAVLLWLRGHRRMALLGVPLLLIVLLLVPTFRERLATAFVSGRENSLLWRFGLWEHALSFFPARPLFGSGPGTFLEYVAYDKGFAPHQTWLGLLIETGLLGVLTFLGVMLALARALYRRWHASLPEVDPLAAAAYAIWAGLMVGSLTASVFGLPSVVVYFWALAALALHPGGPVVGAGRAERG